MQLVIKTFRKEKKENRTHKQTRPVWESERRKEQKKKIHDQNTSKIGEKGKRRKGRGEDDGNKEGRAAPHYFP